MKKRIAGTREVSPNGKVWTWTKCSQCSSVPSFVKKDGIFCGKCGNGKTDVSSIKIPIPPELANHFPVE